MDEVPHYQKRGNLFKSAGMEIEKEKKIKKTKKGAKKSKRIVHFWSYILFHNL